MISQWFEPEPQCRGLVFGRELALRGHQVTVVTGYPNYPGGQLYPGYRQKLVHSEILDGVLVIRVPLYTSHDRSVLRRTANYLSFFFSVILRGLVRLPRFDIAYVYHPPITTGLAAAAICGMRRKPFVLDIQDLWPDSVATSGMLETSKAITMIGWLCDFVYKRATGISVISQGFREALVERGVSPAKIEVIGNWCDENALRNPAPSAVGEQARELFANKFNIIFAGNMGEMQNLDVVIDAAILAHTSDARIQFVFVGSGTRSESHRKRCFEEGISCVRFLPQMPISEVGAVMQLADAALVHLSDRPLFAITVPSKTQAAMALGKPILMAVRGEASKLVEEERAGVVACPDNPESIAAAALVLSSMSPDELCETGRRALQAYDSLFAREQGVERFERFFESRVAVR